MVASIDHDESVHGDVVTPLEAVAIDGANVADATQSPLDVVVVPKFMQELGGLDLSELVEDRHDTVGHLDGLQGDAVALELEGTKADDIVTHTRRLEGDAAGPTP